MTVRFVVGTIAVVTCCGYVKEIVLLWFDVRMTGLIEQRKLSVKEALMLAREQNRPYYSTHAQGMEVIE